MKHLTRKLLRCGYAASVTLMAMGCGNGSTTPTTTGAISVSTTVALSFPDTGNATEDFNRDGAVELCSYLRGWMGPEALPEEADALDAMISKLESKARSSVFDEILAEGHAIVQNYREDPTHSSTVALLVDSSFNSIGITEDEAPATVAARTAD